MKVGKICVANTSGASLGSYLSKNGCFWAKTGQMGPIKMALAPNLHIYWKEVGYK